MARVKSSEEDVYYRNDSMKSVMEMSVHKGVNRRGAGGTYKVA